MKQSTTTATGIAVPADLKSSLATTQALWRFLSNDKVTPKKLIAPLRHFAQQQVSESKSDYVLAITDWSKLDYKKHKAKKDVVHVSHKQDIGYDLTCQLLVSADTGQPLAPVQMHLKTADGFLSTAETPPSEHVCHLEQVLPLMRDASAMSRSAKMVHIIDREADSVFHLRQWHAEGFHSLVRAIDNRHVRWRDNTVPLREIKAQLESEGAFIESREVTIDGREDGRLQTAGGSRRKRNTPITLLPSLDCRLPSLIGVGGLRVISS